MMLRTAITWLAISASSILVMRGVQALADGSSATDSVPGLLAYDGTLAKDGVAYTGTVTLVFTLHDGVGTLDAAWSETQTVEVERGRFSVLLGNNSEASSDALESLLANADDLYLGIALQGDAGLVSFGKRQRLLSAANALWAPATTDAVFSQRVHVKAGVEVADDEGTLVLTPNSIEGLSELRNTVTTGASLTALRLSSTRSGNTSDIVEHLSGDRLGINQGPNYLDGGVTIDGLLSLPGTVSGIESTTSTYDCVSQDLGALGSGSVTRVCADGQIWVGGTWQGLNNNGKFVQFMRCCPFKITLK